MYASRLVILLACLACVARGQILSNVFGSNMVLQRAPVSASLYGWSAASDTITVVVNDQAKYQATADGAGAWNVSLAPTSAGGPYTILVASSDDPSATVTISNVYFGDVFLCGGQSNMQFTVNGAFNASEIFQSAGNYSNIRIFTVGQSTSSNTPLNELGTIEQGWSVVNATTLGSTSAAFSYFSAVCYFTAISVLTYTEPDLPLGLISSNWGGTMIQSWMTNDAQNLCPQTGETVAPNKLASVPSLYSPSAAAAANLTGGNLWNAMIVPYIPMRIAAFLWYQAEANVGQTDLYRCLFPAMINDWRAKWGQGNLPFFFAQLAPYTTDGPLPYPWSLPDMRLAQTSGLLLPNVAMISTIDLGDTGSPWTNIHPREKIPVGERMALAAKALLYGFPDVIYEGPTLSSATIASNYPDVSVILNFLPNTIGGGLQLRPAYCPSAISQTLCSTWEIGLNDGSWHNATATIVQNVAVELTIPSLASAHVGAPAVNVSAVRYLYNDWPVAPLFSLSGLPASPFYFNFVE